MLVCTWTLPIRPTIRSLPDPFSFLCTVQAAQTGTSPDGLVFRYVVWMIRGRHSRPHPATLGAGWGPAMGYNPYPWSRIGRPDGILLRNVSLARAQGYGWSPGREASLEASRRWAGARGTSSIVDGSSSQDYAVYEAWCDIRRLPVETREGPTPALSKHSSSKWIRTTRRGVGRGRQPVPMAQWGFRRVRGSRERGLAGARRA